MTSEIDRRAMRPLCLLLHIIIYGPGGGGGDDDDVDWNVSSKNMVLLVHEMQQS